MPLNLKDLIVVLFLSTIVFIVVRPTAVNFCSPKDFARRRNAYYVLTCAAFLGPSFWVYAAVAVPTLLIVGRRDKHPAAAYLFLIYVIPPLVVPTPIFGMRTLLDFNNQVLLSILLVIPSIRRWQKLRPLNDHSGRLQLLDWIFLAFGVLSSFLYLHVLQRNGAPYPSTLTESMRRFVSFVIVGFLPYYLISRTVCSRAAVLDSAASLLIPGILMSVIGIFESAKGWLLYEVIPENWGVAGLFSSYLMRGNSLRAMASAGHSLALGYLLDIALGVWLALSSYIPSRVTRIGVTLVLILGLFVAYSRGPWACAILIYLAFSYQKPNALSGIAKALMGAATIGVALAFSPLGPRIAAVIPFFGGRVDVENIYYRQHLWDRVWLLFKQSPILGDQYALSKMQDLRQGQGIVDFVNGYASELLSAGSVGMGLFSLVILITLVRTFRAVRLMNKFDTSFGMVGAAVSSCVIGTMFLWAFGGPSELMLWALVAIGIGYSRFSASQKAPTANIPL